MGNLKDNRFVVPIEILNKAQLVEKLLLDKILFTCNVKETCEDFRGSSDYLGNFMDVEMFKTREKEELYGITQIPTTKHITRYYRYRLQYTDNLDVSAYESDDTRTILFKEDKKIIIYTNHNDSQTMVILINREGSVKNG